MSWEMAQESLEDLKVRKWGQIKEARNDAEYGGFTLAEMTFDSDPISQSKIQGAVQLALLAPDTFTIDWTLKDNTVLTITKPVLLAVGIALGQHVQQVYGRGRELRTQIDSATTQGQIEAITW